MSYEIIYKIFTIEKDNKVIPFIVCGSNNCTEMTWKGRERRERNLHQAFSIFNNQRDFNTVMDLEKHFEKESIQKDLEGGNIQGRYKTTQSIINAFKKYTFTSQEIKMRPRLSGLYYVKITDTQKKWVESVFKEQLKEHDTVLTEQEKQNIIDNCFKQFTEEVKQGLDNYYPNRLDWITYYYRDNEYKIENAFKQKYKTQRAKPKSTSEIDKELQDKPFIKLDENNLSELENKTILIYNMHKNLITKKGKIKSLLRGGYGFFPSGSRRRYLTLGQIWYYKMVE